MVVLGADVHQRMHTVVAADQIGRKLTPRTVRSYDAGCVELIAWARRNWPGTAQERLRATEDCPHMSGRLQRALLTAGERMVRVPPRLMHRSVSHLRSKSGPIDALRHGASATDRPGPGCSCGPSGSAALRQPDRPPWRCRTTPAPRIGPDKLTHLEGALSSIQRT